MKKAAYILAFLALSAAPLFAQHGTPEGPPITTVSALGHYMVKGKVVAVTDGTSATDCGVGGGSTAVLCQFDGSSWAAIGGTGGANTTLSNLTDPTAINVTTLTFAGDAGMTGGSGVYQTLISGGTSTGSSVKINPYVGGGGQILAQNNTAYMDFNSINFRPSTLNQTVVRATGTVATTVFPLSCPTAASTCTVDLSRSNIFQITLTAAVTSVVFNFPVSGVTYTFGWIQDGTGETVSGFPAAWHGITAPGSTASTYSRQDCDWNGSIAICGVANTNIP